MKKTVKALNEAQQTLKEAIALLEEGSLQSLLDYFQVGYTSGTWHLPSITTKSLHEVENRVAMLLNDLLLPHGFFINEARASQTGELILYYGSKEEYEESKKLFTRKGLYMATINRYQRHLNHSVDYTFTINQLKEEIKIAHQVTANIQQQIDQIKSELDGTKQSLGFLQRKHVKKKDQLQALKEELHLKEEEKTIKIQNIENKIKQNLEIKESLSKIVEILTPYGFTFSGSFINTEKNYAIYELLEEDEGVIREFAKRFHGWLYCTDHFLIFEKNHFSQEYINELSKEIRFKPFELMQTHIQQFIYHAEEWNVTIKDINFHFYGEKEPSWLKEGLQEALQEKSTPKLRHILQNYQQKGYDIKELSFELAGHTIFINKNGKMNIKGVDVNIQHLLRSHPLAVLLGTQKVIA